MKKGAKSSFYRFLSKIILCIAVVATMVPCMPETEVKALDTTIINYMDVEIPAYTGSLTMPEYTDPNTYWGFYIISTVTGTRSSFKLSNIKFNRVTRVLSYDMSEVKFSINVDRAPNVHGGGEEAMKNQLAFTEMFVDQYVVGDYENLTGYVDKDFAAPYTMGYGTAKTGKPFYFQVIKYPSGEYFQPITPNTRGDNFTVPAGSYSWDMTERDWLNHRLLTRDPKSIRTVFKWQDYIYNGFASFYPLINSVDAKLEVNSPPTLSLTTQNGATLYNVDGQNILNVTGYAQDPDNEELDIIIEVPNVFYRRVKVFNSYTAQYFSVPIDAINDSVLPGSYTGTVTVVDRRGYKAGGQFIFNVKNKLLNKNFYLVDSPVEVSSSYADYEGDPQISTRFRYEHNPSYFDNPTSMLSDSGLWRSSMYSSFAFPGWYNAIVQVRDNPLGDSFDEFRKWSRDNESSLIFLIHRKPTAMFAAKLIGNSIQIIDNSYDIDHTTADNKGLYERQWQWRKVGEDAWNDGQLSSRPTSDAYELRLRVRDVDGPKGVGVWSDWTYQLVGTGSNLPPVANFIIDPVSASYRKSTTITDKSYDPDNDALDTYEWVIRRNGVQLYYYNGSFAIPPSLTNYGVGTYEVVLRVRDSRGAWSNYYTQWANVINNKPIAQFAMPSQVYRDDIVVMDNKTPDPDADGDPLTYTWYGRKGNASYIYAGSNRNQNVVVRDLIRGLGISERAAISPDWEMRLNVSDGSQTAYATQMFEVLNHTPTADITGPSDTTQYTTRAFTSGATDLDSSDVSSLQYYWRVIDSEGQATLLQNNKSINVNFYHTGVYTIEHWVFDQIGAKSNIVSLKVTVRENLKPAMTLTAPAGTSSSPTIIDAGLAGDPLIQWTYADPENDLQEKYTLEFYTKDSILAKSYEYADSSGTVRQFQVPNGTFDRFQLFTVVGRVYSMNSWSDISNEKAFIIDNPPQPGFTMITDTGRNAATGPIYRTDLLNIQSTATDADIPSGDSVTHQYYLKPAGGTEGLASAAANFTKQFTTNGSFILRQIVTDSLGLKREVSQTITVANRLPAVNITYPTSSSQVSPTVSNTLTPVIKWDYQDADGDAQQRYKVRIYRVSNGTLKAESGEQVSGAKQWTVPAGSLQENEPYAVEVEAYDGFGWSSISPRKYMLVNLLAVKGAVQHTAEWNANRQAYNVKKTGDPDSPRGYSVFWAGEKFVLKADATGLPSRIQVTMSGGFTTELTPTSSERTLWTGELYDPSFEKLPDGPVTFTFRAENSYSTKTDSVTVTILEDWTDFIRNHRIK
ncbi:hypothetical protein [Paenibacillus tepidiphilus]|uniref:hypothetical protein n=1 Tax=Paenibacillus tepidiphilus TaxID=2608683 RepID=UPI00123AEDA2|nr:hypothetical protein [Paenibacillus tepidiphilus]